MSDNNVNSDIFDELNDTLGMLLSVWANYTFDEDNPTQFFDTTSPFVQSFVEKYHEVETAARSALPTQSTPLVEDSPAPAAEDVLIQLSNVKSEQNGTGSEPPAAIPIDTDINFATSQEDNKLEISYFDETAPAADVCNVEPSMGTSFHFSTNDSMIAASTVETEMMVSPSGLMRESQNGIQVEKDNDTITPPDFSFNDTASDERPAGSPIITPLVSSKLLERVDKGLLSYSDESVSTATTEPSNNLISSNKDTLSSFSRKRRFGDTIFQEDLEKPTEPTIKRPRFSDLLLGPLQPHMSLFGTSRPQVHLQLGNSMNNVEENSNLNSLDDTVDDTRDSVVDAKVIDTTVSNDNESCAVDNIKICPPDTHSFSSGLEQPLLSRDIDTATGGNDSELVEDKANESTNDAETPDLYSFSAKNVSDNEEVVSSSADKSDESANDEQQRSAISSFVQAVGSLVSTSDLVGNMDVSPVNTFPEDESCVVPVEETVAPQQEMPSFFPSLFGRSVKCDVSPIESPEKFGGVYGMLFKDLLVKTETEEANDEIMPMEIRTEPIQDVSLFGTPDLQTDSFSSTVCLDDSVIHDLVYDIIDKVCTIGEITADSTVSLSSDGPSKSVFDEQPTVASPSSERIVEHHVNTTGTIDVEIRNIVEEIVSQVECPLAETFDHGAFDYDDSEMYLDPIHSNSFEVKRSTFDGQPTVASPSSERIVEHHVNTTGTIDVEIRNIVEEIVSQVECPPAETFDHGAFDFGDSEMYHDSDLLNCVEVKRSTLDEQHTALSFNNVTFDHSLDNMNNMDTENYDNFLIHGENSDGENYDGNVDQSLQNHATSFGSPSGYEEDVNGDNAASINMNNDDTEQEIFTSYGVNILSGGNEPNDEEVDASSAVELDENDAEAPELKHVVNNSTDDNEEDDAITESDHQDSEQEAPNALKKLGSGSRSVYIPAEHNPEEFLVTGRNDGSSTHFIPIFKHNSQLLAQQEEQDAIVPFALRTSNTQTTEKSGESKAAFRQAVDAIEGDAQRLSLPDVIARHNTQNDEVIVLNSDDEDDDSFNQTAREFILDADSSSDNPSPVKVHPSLTKVLKKHQTEGISFLYKCLIGRLADVTTKNHTGAILAHCMGLGKTLQTITFLHTVLNHPQLRKNIRRVLILCPPGVVLNWCAEFKAWLTDLDKSLNTVKVYEVSTTQKTWTDRNKIIEKWAKEDASVIVMGYEMFILSIKNLSPNLLLSPGPDILVCDESHLLNSEGRQKFQSVRKIPTLRRISLTGTPIQNDLHEYFHMVDFVTPGLLGTFQKFQKKFMVPISAATTKEANEKDVEVMKKKASVLWKQLEMVMNRKNFSVLSRILPKKTEHVIFLRLTVPQRKLYEHYLNLKKNSNRLAQRQVFADEHTVYRIGTYPYLVKIGDENKKAKKDSSKLGDWYSRILKENKCGEKSFETGTKLVIFVDLLKMFEKLGEKTIVFTHYIEVIDVLVKLLDSKASSWFDDNHPVANREASWSWKRDKDFYVIQGDTAAAKRHKMIKEFNDPANKRGRLFFCSDAGTVGTNMTGGTRIILFESKHNPAKEIQAIFRAFRIGQANPVFTYRLIAEGTMEDCIFKRQIVKQQTAARVLDNEGVTRTIEGTDINELLRFTPAALDMDFTKKPDYVPSGDKEFNDFCIAHREMIVGVCDNDALIAFNEEEKLSVDVVDKEWQKHVAYSLQDDVFSSIQDEESKISLASEDDTLQDLQQNMEPDVITIDDIDQPCSSRPIKSSPSASESSASRSAIGSSSRSQFSGSHSQPSAFTTGVGSSRRVPPVYLSHVLQIPAPRPTLSTRILQSPALRPTSSIRVPQSPLNHSAMGSSMPSKSSNNRPPMLFQQPGRPPFMIRTTSPSSATVRQPVRRNDTPRPVPRRIISQARNTRPTSIARPIRPFGNSQPNIIGQSSTPASQSALSSSINRANKRQKSPEVVCLDDGAPPQKVSKSDSKGKK